MQILFQVGSILEKVFYLETENGLLDENELLQLKIEKNWLIDANTNETSVVTQIRIEPEINYNK
ncbi:MAG: hypothetical protein SFU98_15015 [Leptospiraceae bacterium]|nr:hypothetical protein [Leptospiraceae bacterium]